VENTRVAAIDIGSSAIRMTIAEIINDKVNILEELRQPVRLGKDSFHKGKILRPTINEAILVLKKYKKLCEEYNVSLIKTVATTAVREATNVDIFIDNIKTFTDIDVEILSTTKETLFIHRALIKQLEENNEIKEKEYQAIIEVGAGTVEVTIFSKECIVFSRSLPLGTLKMKQIFNKYSDNEEHFFRYLKAIVSNELRTLKRDIPTFKIKKIYGIGSELDCISKVINGENNQNMPVDKKEFQKLCDKIQSYAEEEMIHRLKISYDLTETFYATNIMFLKILDFFKADSFNLPKVSLRDGIIENILIKQNNSNLFSQFEKQVKINATNIGRALNFDEKHAKKVLEYALIIFEKTKEIHHLGDIEKSYLIVSCLLHDVGTSISNRSHHKHSLYVINAQEFLHFGEVEKNIIANVARYHRRSPPKTTHPDYMRLSNKHKMIVIKLASILRIADSFDNSNLQLVESIDLKIEDEKVIIICNTKKNIYAEAYSFKYKKDMFEDFFGIAITLKIKRI